MISKTKFNPDIAAAALIEAVFYGEQKTVEKYGISPRTMRNWRRRLVEDAEFAALFQRKKAQFENSWLNRLTVPIQRAMDFIADACSTMDARQRSNPEMIHAVAGALKICADVYLTSKALNVGASEQDRETQSVPEQVFGETVVSSYQQ